MSGYKWDEKLDKLLSPDGKEPLCNLELTDGPGHAELPHAWQYVYPWHENMNVTNPKYGCYSKKACVEDPEKETENLVAESGSSSSGTSTSESSESSNGGQAREIEKMDDGGGAANVDGNSSGSLVYSNNCCSRYNEIELN